MILGDILFTPLYKTDRCRYSWARYYRLQLQRPDIKNAAHSVAYVYLQAKPIGLLISAYERYFTNWLHGAQDLATSIAHCKLSLNLPQVYNFRNTLTE